jgi:hypothetical protein
MTTEQLKILNHKNTLYVVIPALSIMTALIWLIGLFDLEVLRPFFYISGAVALLSQLTSFGILSIIMLRDK